MVAASILPVAVHAGKLYFLFGLENENENSAKGWSDFGGRVEQGESIYEAALREGTEESTGIFGSRRSLDSAVKRGKLHRVSHNDYHVHMFNMQYDEALPAWYNNMHEFLWENTGEQELRKTHYEKIKMKWFSETDLVAKRNSFRPFYRLIVDKIVDEIPLLKRRYNSGNRRTKRN